MVVAKGVLIFHILIIPGFLNITIHHNVFMKMLVRYGLAIPKTLHKIPSIYRRLIRDMLLKKEKSSTAAKHRPTVQYQGEFYVACYHATGINVSLHGENPGSANGRVDF